MIAKCKGVVARRGLKEAWSKRTSRSTRTGCEAYGAGRVGNPVRLVCDTPTAGVCSITSGTGTGVGVYDGSPGRPNIFRARQTGLNSVVLPGVPVDPPGVGKTRTFRVSNVLLNASGLGPLMVPPTLLYGFVANIESVGSARRNAASRRF